MGSAGEAAARVQDEAYEGGCVYRPVCVHVGTRVCVYTCMCSGWAFLHQPREALVPQEKLWIRRGCKEALLQSLGWFVDVGRAGWAGGPGRRDGSNWPHERR